MVELDRTERKAMKTTCGDPSDDPVIMILPRGDFLTFCDLECAHRWIEVGWNSVLREVRKDLQEPERAG